MHIKTIADFESLVNSTSETDWTDFSIQIMKYNEFPISSKVENFAIGLMKDSLSKSNYQLTYNYAVVNLAISNFNIINNPLFFEAFNLTNLDLNNINPIKNILKKIIQLSLVVNFPLTVKNTFISISNYLNVLESYWLDVSEIQSFAKENSDWLFATALSYLEEAFLGNRPLKDSILLQAEGRNSPYSKENISTGVSFLLNTVSMESPLNIQTIDHTKIKNLELIILSCIQLNEFREILPTLLRMGYIFEKIEDNKFKWFSPIENFEKALTLGYIKNRFQQNINVQIHASSKSLSFYQICEMWVEKYGEEFYPVKNDNGHERLVVGFYEPLFKVIAECFKFRDNDLFLEEEAELQFILDELNIEKEEFLETKILNNFSFFDFLKIHRATQFLSITRSIKLQELFKNNKPVYEQSTIGATPIDNFIKQYTLMGYSHEEIQSYLKVLSWGENPNDVPRDLQYYPIIHWKKKFVFLPFSFVYKTNIFRNTLISQKIRPHHDGKIDHMGKLLLSELSPLFNNCKDNIDYTYKGQDGQIDFLLLIESTLYILECKNTLYPCNPYELRTTFDHLDKAVDKQLSKICTFSKEKEFIDYLFRKIGWSIPQEQLKIQTSILLNHRLLSGSSYKGHPVRHIKEFVNFIKTGTAKIGTRHKMFTKNYWEGDKFKNSDLEKFLSGNSDFYNDLFSSFNSYESKIFVGKNEIISYDLPLDTGLYAKKFGISPEDFNALASEPESPKKSE